jgi:hypothetical protein
MLNLTEDTITRYVPCALCVFQLLGDQRSAVVKSVYWGALASAGFAMLTKWFSYTRPEGQLEIVKFKSNRLWIKEITHG